jgi:pimeloyl-ACP methyl ester carboxylesterase
MALSYIRTKFKLLSAISKKKAAEKAFELFCTPQRRNKKPLPKIFSQAEKLQFRIDGILVQGWRWNNPSTRKALILHGFESSATNFDRYIRPLVKKGYEVLAFDAPAHGRSGGSQINAPLYKRMILEINKRYGPVRSYIAHSFGGLAAALALEEIPHTGDYRLVLIAPATETVTAVDYFFTFLQLDPGIRAGFEKIIVEKSGFPSAWYSVKRALQHTQARTLWFHDRDDEITPLSDVLKVKAENYPQIEFVFSSGLGHRRIYRDHNVSKAIIDFL